MMLPRGWTPTIDRKQAMLAAIRHFQTVRPDAKVREVRAHLWLKRWVVHFEKLLPPDVIEIPGSWTIFVDADTGETEWFEAM
jgi:hypothetical protein